MPPLLDTGQSTGLGKSNLICMNLISIFVWRTHLCSLFLLYFVSVEICTYFGKCRRFELPKFETSNFFSCLILDLLTSADHLFQFKMSLCKIDIKKTLF